MRKRMRKRKNKISTNENKKILWVLEHVENKQAFLESLFDSLIASIEANDLTNFRDNLDSWIASAEIDSIPESKKRIFEAHNAYLKDKRISRNWSDFTKRLGISQQR